MDNSMTAEQQALFASIMSNAQPKPVAPVAPAVGASSPIGGDPNRMLSQAEIDALIASLTG